MGLNAITTALVQKYLPARVLSLGYPDEVHRLDLNGSILHSVDLFPHRGCEQIADLSVPQDLGKWQLVLDMGTTEHVVNPAQCFLNAAEAVEPGGRIIHHLPMTMVNHGYWEINPSFIIDFYCVNGWFLEVLEFTTKGNGTYDEGQILPWDGRDRSDRFELPPECLVLAVARRTNDARVVLPKCERKWGT